MAARTSEYYRFRNVRDVSTQHGTRGHSHLPQHGRYGCRKKAPGFRVSLRTSEQQSELKAVAIVIATATRLKEAEAFAGVPGIDETIKQNLISSK